MKLFELLKTIVILLLLFSTQSLWAWSTNQSAKIVVGQTDMVTNTVGTSSTKIDAPQKVFYKGNQLIFSDHSNHRVLIYNLLPNTNGAAANVVIGQPDMNSGAENRGGAVASNTLACPQDMFISREKLFVADMKNNRVLIYDPVPTMDNASASVVIGQVDGEHNQANQGGVPGANTLHYPHGLCVYQNKLIVTDYMNNRVLIYNNIPTNNNAAADVVIGQTDFTTTTDGYAANKLYWPQSVAVENGKLFIADSGNHRVLIYNSIPTNNNTSADIVIGQQDFTTKTSGCTQYKFNTPAFVSVEEGKIVVADSENIRVLIFNSIPITNYPKADTVLGQINFTDSTTGLSDKKFIRPRCSFLFETKVLVADTYNHRVLIFEDDFTVNCVQPEYAVSGKQVEVNISGTGLPDNPNIELYNGSQQAGISSIQKINDQLLQCAADLTGLNAGYFNIKVVGSSENRELSKAMTVLKPSVPPLDWQTRKIAFLGLSALAGDQADISIGDADNDNENEIIIANRNLYLTKLDLLANGWHKTSLPNAGAGENYISACVTDGDHDNKKEVFSGSINNQIYVLEEATWDRTSMGTAANDITCINYGEGNNDGWSKVYVGTRDGEIYQFKKTSSSAAWESSNLGKLSGALNVTGISIGDGDNDGDFDIFTSNENGKIYQYNYNGSSWTIEEIASKSSAMIGLAIGNLDEDNKNDVYCANVNGVIYRYQWAISSWPEETIIGLTETITCMSAGDSNNNGCDDIIVGCSNGAVYHIEYVNNGWQKNKVADVQTKILAIEVGDGDNDYQHEVYAIDENNDVFEVNVMSQVPPTPTPVVAPKGFDGRIISKKTTYAYPQPARGGRVKFKIYTAESSQLTLKIYTTTNYFVHSMDIAATQTGDNILEWNYSNMANGVYLYLVKVKGHNSGIEEKVIRRVAIIK